MIGKEKKKIKILCIIPARGGSKRIPNKNIILLFGKPLIAYTIEHAKKSKLINRIIVSTDSDKIADVSTLYEVEVIKRPSKLATDNSTSESVLKHVLIYLEKEEKYYPDIIVFLQCTSPLRENDDIDKAINTLINEEADSLFSAFKFKKFIWEKRRKYIKSINYDYKHRIREQSFHGQYQENGSIYVFKPWMLKLKNNRLGGKISIYEMSYLNSFQIDNFEDFELCEYILRKKEK